MLLVILVVSSVNMLRTVTLICNDRNIACLSGKEKAHKHEQIFPVTARVGGCLPTGWPGVSRPVARGQKFMCCVRNLRNIDIFVRVPGRRIGYPAGRIGDRGDREIVYVPNVYVPFPAPRTLGCDGLFKTSLFRGRFVCKQPPSSTLKCREHACQKLRPSKRVKLYFELLGERCGFFFLLGEGEWGVRGAGEISFS